MILEVEMVVPLGERKEYDWERLQIEFLKVMEILYFLTYIITMKLFFLSILLTVTHIHKNA